MFTERSDCRKGLVALVTLDLHATIGVHPFVTAQIGKLSVRFETHFTLEWFDATVNVGVLLEAAGRGESLSTFRTGVRSSSYVLRSNMPLKITGIGEDFVAVFARITSAVFVRALMTQKIRFPTEDFRTLVTFVFSQARFSSVVDEDQMFFESRSS